MTEGQAGGEPVSRADRHSRWGWTLLVLVALVVWGLSASRPGSRVRGCPDGCSTDSVPAEGPVRILSLNMLHGFPGFERLEDRLDLIAAEIRRADVDIVCLQEVPWSWRAGDSLEHLGKLSGMNYLGLRANGNRWAILFEEGEAILSRFPLLDPLGEELAPRASFFQHRVVLKATAATPAGDLDIYVTHLTHDDAQANRDQAASLQRLVERTAHNPAIVAGDLNAKPDSSQIRLLTSSWIDSYPEVNGDDPGYTCCVDDLAAKDGGRTMGPLVERIDYLFVVPTADPGVRVKSVTRIFDQPYAVDGGWLWASDHAGLLAEVEIGTGGRPRRDEATCPVTECQ